jgi:potassium/sodium efflux P-type ATPase
VIVVSSSLDPSAAPAEAGAVPVAPPEPATLSVDEVVAALVTDPDRGLSATEAARRLAHVGPNELPQPESDPWWRRLVDQFADPLVYLLLVAMGISLAIWIEEGARGVPFDAVVIAAIVVLNAVIGFIQEHKAEQAVAALRAMTRTEATVVRDGTPVRVPAAELVPGDLVVMTDGDLVPADARLIETVVLRTAEAAVTGESNPVSKSTDAVAPGTPLGDRVGMVLSGTAVATGRGRAVVTATGRDTEVGHIATLLEETEDEPTPLQNEIARVGAVLGIAVLVIALVVVATLVVVDGVRTAAGLVDAALIGVSLAVAAVPEGLPAVLSLVLALGVQRMSKRNALVKSLPAVETLGSATVICSDKTGTLTRNEMMVRRLVVPSGEVEVTGSGYGPTGELTVDGVAVTDEAVLDEVRWALLAGGLASDASVTSSNGRFAAVGDPTEAALVAAEPKVGLDPAQVGSRFVRRAEIPFTAERKRMSTVTADGDDGDRLMMATKGAPDLVVPLCRAERRNGRVVDLDDERRRWWHDAVEGLAGQALRTLALAYRPVDEAELANGDELGESAERGLVLLGVVGIIDPPRVEAREAVTAAQRAGIRVAMITGDHPATAGQIAAELGITDDAGAVVTTAQLAAAADDELAALVASATVYARVDPEQKLHIVQALHGHGEVVAMTGDGVNDAPALKAADIGVAMGITGTDVSKEAADMILTDDNFATIVEAVSEGRAIFHNIRSFLRYLLSSNVGEVLTVFLGVVGAGVIGLTNEGGTGLTAPLLAVQILWINLVTDAAPALALGVDPPQPGLMERRPRRLDERVIDRRMQFGIVVVGLTMALATLAALDLGLPGGLFGVVVGSDGLTSARTAAFTTLVMAQLFNTFNARSDTESIWGQLTVNRWLLIAIALSLGLQFMVIYLPVLNEAFDTVPLGLTDWLVATALASSVVWVAEVRKAILRWRTPHYEQD